jgi:hypothetical protein
LVEGHQIGITVTDSKPGDCPAGTTSLIEISALEEMHNQFLERMDSATEALAQRQGKDELPPAPPPDARPVAGLQTQPYPGAAPAIQQELRSADVTEAQIKQEASIRTP